MSNNTATWRTGLISLSLLGMLLPEASALGEVDQKAAQLIMLHRYQSAIEQLTPTLNDSGNEQSKLLMGTVFYKSAELHQELAAASIKIIPQYLGKLGQEKGKQRSQYVDLFLGIALLEQDKIKAALEKFKRVLTAKKVSVKYFDIAKAYQSLALYKKGDVAKAKSTLKKIKSAEPEVQAVLAGIYHRMGLSEYKPAAMMDKIVAQFNATAVTPLVLENALTIYATRDSFTKGLQLIKRDSVSSPIYVEQIGADKSLAFYSLVLPRHIANIHYFASLHYLEQSRKSSAFRGIADYYLAAAYLTFGELSKAGAAVAEARNGGSLATAYDNRAEIMQAVLRHAASKKPAEKKQIVEVGRRYKGKPELMAVLLLHCADMSLNCESVLDDAKSTAERSQSERFRGLHSALGFYYLQQGDSALALSYMETGRDKSMKNKMETNDPLMLVRLAQLYLAEKSFSENLEIYFELGKEYPVVRQIQEAVQGVYGMEFRSAGDVKIF